MNKQMASLIAIALFLLAGCAASGPKLASSAEDIAGTWKSTISSVEVQFNEDGTLLLRPSPGSSDLVSEFRFEGTRLFWKALSPGSDCVRLGAEASIYEIELLENGNLKFTVIEDGCATRANTMQGATVAAEWEPVP